jgi:hypothetical protein
MADRQRIRHDSLVFAEAWTYACLVFASIHHKARRVWMTEGVPNMTLFYAWVSTGLNASFK